MRSIFLKNNNRFLSGYLKFSICLAFLPALFFLPSAVFSATFVTGVTNPTGLAIHPTERALYVKNGSAGTVWKVIIRSDGTAGAKTVVASKFNSPTQIVFDAAGNLYGTYGTDVDQYIIKRDPSDYICDNLVISPPGSMAVESPGLVDVNNLYYVTNEEWPSDLFRVPLSTLSCGNSARSLWIGSTCSKFRYLLYRPTQADLVGTSNDKLYSVSLRNGTCSMMLYGMTRPAGIAMDTQGNLYVADSGAGKIIKRDSSGKSTVVATGLSYPNGLVFDSVTGSLFIAESTANRVTRLPVGSAMTGKITLRIKNSAGSWSATIQAPSQTSPTTPAACTDAADNLYVFITKSDNTIYMVKRTASGTWGSWTKVPGTVKTASAVTAAQTGGKINLYARGLDDKIWEAEYTISSNTWGAWKAIAGLDSPDSPEATFDESGNTYVLVRGAR